MAGQSTYPGKADFIEIYEYLVENREGLLAEVKRQKSDRAIYSYIECIMHAPWDAETHEFYVKIAGVDEDTVATVQTDVNKYLEKACSALPSPRRVMAVGLIPGRPKREDGTRERYLYWKDTKQPANAAERWMGYRRVVVVGSLRTGELNSEIMRGIRSMARELNIELDDRMKWDAMADANPLSANVREAKMNPEVDSLLVRNEDPLDLSGDIGLLEADGYHIITTGFATGHIRQNLKAIGMILADRCITDQKRLQPDNILPGDGYVVVMHEYSDLVDGKTTAIGILQESFRATLRGKSHFKVVPAPKKTPYYGLNYDLMRGLYPRFLKKLKKDHGANSIAAILVPDESYCLAALHAVREEKDPDLCRIYSERIVRSILETHRIGMEQKDGRSRNDGVVHLHAACGVEPYFFGRYALRAASYKADTAYLEAAPVLITISDIVDRHIIAPDRIPAFHDGIDVQFNNAKFAWEPWMRERCKGSYGPDLIK